MIRIAFETLVLFLIPFALFAGWLMLSKKSAFDPEHWSKPFLILVISGLVLIALSFVFSGVFAERHLDTYVPAHMENGKFVPGGFK